MPVHAHRPPRARHHRPGTLALFERESAQRHRPGPVARLHDQRTVDDRIDHFAMRVPEHHRVDAIDLARHPSRHIFRWQPRGDCVVARRATQPRMQEDHDHIGLAAAGLAHAITHGGHDIGHREPGGLEVVAVPHHRTGRGGPHDRHVQPLAANPSQWRHERTPLVVQYIGRHEPEARLCDRLPQQWYSVVELVVAQHRGVVAHHVHRCDHRMHRRGRHTRRHVRERVPLQNIAPLHQHHPVGVRAPGGIHDRGRGGEGMGGIGRPRVVIPATQPPVHVGSGGNREVHPPWLGHQRGRQGGQQRTHQPEQHVPGESRRSKRIRETSHGRMLVAHEGALEGCAPM